MFQGNCGTSVGILRFLLNTRQYLKTDKSSEVVSLDLDLHTKGQLIHIEQQDNQQSAAI